MQLGGFYAANEEWMFVRDVGLLFADLPSRSEVRRWLDRVYLDPRGPGRESVYLQPGSLDEKFYVDNGGSDIDANVHHWAWAFGLGYFYGPIFATSVNTGRERRAQQSDIEMGGDAIQMGYALGRRGTTTKDIPRLLREWLSLK